MPVRWQDQAWSRGLWYRGKVTRRTVLGLGAAAAGALGAVLLEPPPWRAAFGQAKPYRIGSLQPLTGAAAAGGRMALIGGRHQRPPGRADRRGLPVGSRHGPA